MDPRDAIGKGLDIYRNEMRVFIRETLLPEYGEPWFSEQVAPLLHGKQKRERGLRAVLTRGQSAERQIDVGDFAIVIAHHGGLFPEPIRRGQHHHGRLDELRDARNKHAHDQEETLYPSDAEAVLGKCREVLSLCGRMSAVRAIESIAHQLSAVPNGQEASVPTPIEDAVPPTITDAPEDLALDLLPPSSSAPTGGILRTALRDSRFWTVFSAALLIGGLVVIAIFALQQTSSDGSSAQEQAVAGQQASVRGGSTQEQAVAATQQASSGVGSAQEQAATVAPSSDQADQPADAQSRDCAENQLQIGQSGITHGGSWTSGDCAPNRIGNSMWADHYTFRLDRESRVEIELISADRIPVLILARSLGNADIRLALSVGGALGSQSASVSRTLVAGDYRVEATKHDAGTGDYQLRLTAAPVATSGIATDEQDDRPSQPAPGSSSSSNSATATVAESVQGPIVDDIRCSPWPPSATERVTCTARLSGGEPGTYSWSGGDSVSSSATYVTSFDPLSSTQMVFLHVDNSADNSEVALFGTWIGQHVATASEVLSGLEGIDAIRLRRNDVVLSYGVLDGQVIPGSFNFNVRTGDVLWLNRTEVGNANRSNVVPGRIVMRVVDRTDASGEDDWRIEFGFLPEWVMDGEGAFVTWSDLLPTARYLTRTWVELRARGDNRDWARSSLITVPTRPIEATEAPASEASEVTGRVVVRYNPDSVGRLRIEFGFLPEALVTDTATSEGAIVKDSDVLSPQVRFITESTIANRRDVWMRSSVVEVPIGSGSSAGRFVACGSNGVAVYYVDDSNGTKHWLNISAEQAELIFGRSWWDTVRSLSWSECDLWETGPEYGVTEAMWIGEP